VLPQRDRVNEGTVTIISKSVGGVTSILMSDLARVVDSDEVSVMQVIGKGPVPNVIDILDPKSRHGSGGVGRTGVFTNFSTICQILPAG